MSDTPKRYKVIGESPIRPWKNIRDNKQEYKPGEEFDAVLDPKIEEFLINIGALRVLSTAAPVVPSPRPPAPRPPAAPGPGVRTPVADEG